MSPFEILNVIIKKSDIDWTDISGDYNSWIIDTALSHEKNTLFYANEINKNYNIPSRWQFDFYRNVISKGTKYKWLKVEKSDDLEYIKVYYNVSQRKAEEIKKLLTDDQIIKIKGIKNEK